MLGRRIIQILPTISKSHRKYSVLHLLHYLKRSNYGIHFENRRDQNTIIHIILNSTKCFSDNKFYVI